MIVVLIIVHVLYRYFDYHFYVDFEASMADQSAQNALRHLNVCFNLFLCSISKGFSVIKHSKTNTLYRSSLHSCEC